MRRILLPLVAVALAIGTALYANAWLEGERRAVLAQVSPVTIAAEPEFIEVLVVAERLTPGSFVKPTSWRWQKWPAVEVPESYLLRGKIDAAELEGSVARQILVPGDPILADSLVRPGDRGFLAAVLDPGMRAVSVPVDEASSNAGLIFPGDRVDLILTQTIAGDADGAADRRVSETVLENLRVIAMGRRLHSEPGENADGGQVRTVTLEVDPAGAETVALVTELGKLSLSLRSIASDPATASGSDGPTVPRQTVTWDSDVSRVLRSDDHVRPRLTVMRGAAMERAPLDAESN
ncbi:MAG: Flp pilus assembly protein CpaB [Geminicoccaceae bacterium]|jgi:pilus assembly protein CpaB|nr:Flp pilus assembly protein CpaB [Geminicoccaceae bacterium]MCB9968178.1 Flp pilus assembly protein CpaB [Geminicoccaceae bacterium]HRY23100.1 Flp pilus assembly protein CpaB [Geminicoccaceae bacterium]